MLKTQLHSKIFQLDPAWRDIEDILTGDFFGILDYLPRIPYLSGFIQYVASLNHKVQTPSIEGVDWDQVRVMFWPRTHTDDENAEPDLVIVSNRWVLVIEVKLLSGLGDTQPLREYAIGQKIAEDHGLSSDCVYYLLVARNPRHTYHMFVQDSASLYQELTARTSFLKWHEAFFLIDSWLRNGIDSHSVPADHARMLFDLYRAMRRRRAMTYSGFAFENIGTVGPLSGHFFCPPRFAGFLHTSLDSRLLDERVFFKQNYDGFGKYYPIVMPVISYVFFNNSFSGFIENSPLVLSSDYIFFPSEFSGFSNNTVKCTVHPHVFFKQDKSI